MNKKMLTGMKLLKATTQMMKMAAEDIPSKEKSWYGHECEIFKCGMYMRCAVQHEILKVSLFFSRTYASWGENPRL